jgi:hypothetical protein
VQKVRRSYERTGEKSRTIRSLLEDEIRANVHKKDQSACVGLLWLKRGLDYVMMMLTLVVDSYRKGITHESCTAEFRGAYEYALKRYHNVVMQGIFKMATFAFPKRSHLIKCLSHDNEAASLDETMQRTDAYLRTLRPVIEYINRLFVELKLESADTQHPKDFVVPTSFTDDAAASGSSPTDEHDVERQLEDAAKQLDANADTN